MIEDGRLVRPYPESIAMEEAYYLINVPDQAATLATGLLPAGSKTGSAP